VHKHWENNMFYNFQKIFDDFELHKEQYQI